jgi:hypothetical protein
MNYYTIRDRALKSLSEHPEAYEAICHITTEALYNNAIWPDGWSQEQIDTAVTSLMREMARRWEYLIDKRRDKGSHKQSDSAT